MMKSELKVAIYGDVNANIIDGSAIWLKNIVKLTLCHEQARVWLFLKAPLVRAQLIADLLDHPRIKVIEPSPTYLNGEAAMTVDSAVSLIESHDDAEHFHAVILRGMQLCRRASDSPGLRGRLWTYITDIPQSPADVAPADKENLQAIAAASKYVLCQTEELRSHFSAILDTGRSKLILLPPVVPEGAFYKGDKFAGTGPVKILYTGKFAPAWATETLIDVFTELRRDGFDVELHVAGDKFHRVGNDPAFADRLSRKLKETEGLFWYGGLPQEEVFDLQQSCHIGYGWRDKSLDGSLELSTKLLEYGASGLALIANPLRIHRDLLGDRYPLFASDEKDLKAALLTALQRPQVLQEAADQAAAVAEKFRLESVGENWKTVLNRVFHRPAHSGDSKLRVVLAGHDLKFSNELIEYFHARPDVELRIDQWKSLREHDGDTSRKLAAWANVVFCEWCAGNAVWYSKNVDPRKVKLLIRFHRFEINTEFPPQLKLDSVNRILFVGPHYQREAQAKFDWPEQKTVYLPNFVDVDNYHRPKFAGSAFNLGLIGYVPKLKRLDRALDILERMRARDDRYKLFIKGKHPWEYPWIWRNEEEQSFYLSQLERIKSDPSLRDAVVFDPFGDDVGHWLRKIGHVLSVSDLESFHLAAAEGIASGAGAVFMEREGVAELFPWENVHASAEDAADDIIAGVQSSDHLLAAREQLQKTYGVMAVRHRLDELLTGEQ